MASRKLVILGGPGDGVVVAQVVRDLARAGSEVDLAGFLNDRLAKGETVCGAPVLGALRDWCELPEEILFVPALHKVGEMHTRAGLIKGLGVPEQRWATLVHPSACIADDVTIGCGSVVGSYVTVQPGARLGRFTSVRAGANLGHDSVVEDFGYVGPNATLAGRARLAEGAHLSPNAAVLDRIVVGRYAVVGLAAAVMKNVEEFSIFVGNPARKLRSLKS